jgi:hypothetical protein
MLYHKKRDSFIFLSAVVAVLFMVSCGGPAGPQPGTSAFYWKAAQDTFATGDYAKANDNLEELVKTDNEFTARALPWRLVVTAGMAQGCAELADRFEAGSRANKANPTPFRKYLGNYRMMAGRRTLQFAETYLQFSKRDRVEKVPLDFSYPTGSAGQVQELNRVAAGILIPETAVPAVEKQTLEKGVLLATCEAAGAPDDPAQTQQMFNAGSVEVPYDVFAVAMARNLHEHAKIFGRGKLDKPEHMELFCNEALETLKSVKESKETKELAADITKTLKNAKSR